MANNSEWPCIMVDSARLLNLREKRGEEARKWLNIYHPNLNKKPIPEVKALLLKLDVIKSQRRKYVKSVRALIGGILPRGKVDEIKMTVKLFGHNVEGRSIRVIGEILAWQWQLFQDKAAVMPYTPLDVKNNMIFYERITAKSRRLGWPSSRYGLVEELGFGDLVAYVIEDAFPMFRRLCWNEIMGKFYCIACLDETYVKYQFEAVDIITRNFSRFDQILFEAHMKKHCRFLGLSVTLEEAAISVQQELSKNSLIEDMVTYNARFFQARFEFADGSEMPPPSKPNEDREATPFQNQPQRHPAALYNVAAGNVYIID